MVLAYLVLILCVNLVLLKNTATASLLDLFAQRLGNEARAFTVTESKLTTNHVRKTAKSQKSHKKKRKSGLADTLSRMLFNFLQKTTPDPDPVIIENYEIRRIIRQGAFGKVMLAYNTQNKLYYAAKSETIGSCPPQLCFENKVYEMLGSTTPGIAKIYYFGRFHHNTHNILIMELLGPDLSDLFQACNKVFSHKTVLMIALQTLKLMRHIHSCNIIYRDVKPENFCIGQHERKKENTLYVIDFGLSKIIDPNKTYEAKAPEIDYFIGTARYMSIHAHLAREQSQRDDLESLGYMFLYLLRGSLPWMNVTKTSNRTDYMQKLAAIKSEMILENIVDYEEFKRYFEYVYTLKYMQEPNYDYLLNLIETAFENYSYQNDLHFDWYDIIYSAYMSRFEVEQEEEK